MFQRNISHTVKNLSALVLASQFTGCGGGSGVENVSNASFVPEAFISGSVGDGPVVGATLNIYDKDGNLIQTEMSDNSANYNARIQAAATAYPLIIEVDNGTDLVTGRGPDFRMISVVAHPSAQRVNINPFTTLIVESARSRNGGLSEQNIADVTAAVMSQLNFGLDPALVADPIGSEIDDTNVASIVKASEALGEMIRRARDSLMITGTVSSADDVVNAIADDISDGILDGLGGNRANGRIAAVATIASAQVLIETLSNSLRVDGVDATSALDNAILTTRPTAAADGGLTAGVAVNAEVLDQVRTSLAASRGLSTAAGLQTIADVLDGIAVGTLPPEIEAMLPADTSQDLDPVINLASTATDEQLAVVINPGQGGSTGGSPVNTNHTPVIAGNAATAITAGGFYSFRPTASDTDGDTLSFSINKRPTWASFNPVTGRLFGTPTSADIGTYSNIVISVSDGTDSVSLPAFSIVVNAVAPQTGSISLKWAAPVARADGNALAMGEIAGYTLYYGDTPGTYPNSVAINDAGTPSATVSGLVSGKTYYFVVTARDISGLESGYSSMATRAVQ